MRILLVSFLIPDLLFVVTKIPHFVPYCPKSQQYETEITVSFDKTTSSFPCGIAVASFCRGNTCRRKWQSREYNLVLARNPRGAKSCKQLCGESVQLHSDAEASRSDRGWDGRAIQNGQVVAEYYNYGCKRSNWVYTEEKNAAPKSDMSKDQNCPYSFCCGRKNGTFFQITRDSINCGDGTKIRDSCEEISLYVRL